MSPRPSSVLFACNYNRVRSPMAEGMMRALYGRDIYTDSCGLQTDGGVDPLAIVVMAEIGIDVADHVAMCFGDLDPAAFDLVIAFTAEAHAKAEQMARGAAVVLEFWPLPDPTQVEGSRDAVLDSYRQVRDALQRRLVDRFGAPE